MYTSLQTSGEVFTSASSNIWPVGYLGTSERKQPFSDGQHKSNIQYLKKKNKHEES
jgi:hypothetical protein